jgi:hypothetical protein
MEAGIFAGWAALGDSPKLYKTACSIGFNPVFDNKVGSLARLQIWQ